MAVLTSCLQRRLSGPTVAQLISKTTHVVPGKFEVSELFFSVPKDHRNPDNGSLRIFARAVKDSSKKDSEKHLPWLVFLQGGPGSECAPPQTYPYLRTILDKGYQMLYLDQRGTGLSSAISAATLAQQAPGGAEAQAEYLSLFRADSIVEDCEAIRRCLLKDEAEGDAQKWGLIGQSFGGFCAITYLSKFPDRLREVFICGGLAPLDKNPDRTYEHTYEKVIERNAAYYEKYPEDNTRVRALLHHFNTDDIELPSGGCLTPRRFQQLGQMFGMHGGIDKLHSIVLRAYHELAMYGFLTRSTLSTIQSSAPFDQNPIYAILHEPIYCQGEPAKWSAERVRARYTVFDPAMDTGKPVYFTGEMIYPWMFDDYVELRHMKAAANILAQKSDWPNLYDEAQLAKNEVPVYAVTYMEDMYLHFELAQETARKIKKCKQFITNVMYHDGLSTKFEEVMKQLFALKEDVVD